MKPSQPENEFRFWATALSVVLVFFVVLVVFHRYGWLSNLSIDGYAIVGTTLFAAAAGFLAIVYQVRSSSRQLREQLEDQHRAADEELRRRRCAVAKALRAEIEDWKKHFLAGIQKTVANIDPMKLTKSTLPWMGSPSPDPFEVYRGSVSNIGQFDYDVVTGVVAFYKAASEHIRSYEDYRATYEHLNTPRETTETVEEAIFCLKLIKASTPAVMGLADKACSELQNLVA